MSATKHLDAHIELRSAMQDSGEDPQAINDRLLSIYQDAHLTGDLTDEKASRFTFA